MFFQFVHEFAAAAAKRGTMLELVQKFEQLAMWLNPVLLVGSGLLCLLAGLFVWLGGLGFRALLAGIAGVVVGGICGVFIAGQSTQLVMILAAVGCAAAILFERVFITILTAALAVVLCVSILARPYLEETDKLIPTNRYVVQNRNSSYTPGKTVEIVKAYANDFSTRTKTLCLQFSVSELAITAAVAIIFLLAGYFFRRLTSALCCAGLGTGLCFVGMVLLLLYKDSAPLSRIYNRSLFYTAVFLAMTAFGTVVQLLLCRRIKEKPIRGEVAGESVKNVSEQARGKQQSWRTS